MELFFDYDRARRSMAGFGDFDGQDGQLDAFFAYGSEVDDGREE